MENKLNQEIMVKNANSDELTEKQLDGTTGGCVLEPKIGKPPLGTIITGGETTVFNLEELAIQKRPPIKK